MEEILPDRFWAIWLGCIDKPRSLKKISKEFGYADPSSLYQEYKGKSLVDWMLEEDYLSLTKEGRKYKYKAKFGEFVGKDFQKFLNKDWVRSQLFGIEKIETLFNVEEYGPKVIRKFGFDFLLFILSFLANLSITSYMFTQIPTFQAAEEKPEKFIKLIMEQLTASLAFGFPFFRVGDYISKVIGIILSHLKEISEIYDLVFEEEVFDIEK